MRSSEPPPPIRAHPAVRKVYLGPMPRWPATDQPVCFETELNRSSRIQELFDRMKARIVSEPDPASDAHA